MSACSKGPVYTEAPFDGSRILIDITDLREGVPAFHAYTHKGKKINYIIIKTGGAIQSYFDACAECYKSGKGFRAEGEKLVCNLCNVGYSIHKFMEGEGSCYPFRLEGELAGHIYKIDKEDIIAGAKYF